MKLVGKTIVKQVRSNSQLLINIQEKDVFVPEFVIENEIRKQFLPVVASTMQLAVSSITSMEVEERAKGSTYVDEAGVTRTRETDALVATSCEIETLDINAIDWNRVETEMKIKEIQERIATAKKAAKSPRVALPSPKVLAIADITSDEELVAEPAAKVLTAK